jgi:hypothetical protein
VQTRLVRPPVRTEHRNSLQTIRWPLRTTGIALFDTSDEATRWFHEGGEIDPELWTPNVIELELDADDIEAANRRFATSP